MRGPNWTQGAIGIVIYAVAISAAGILIWLFDEARIGVCADTIVTVLILLISAFIAGLGAREREAATGAMTGLGAVIPQTFLNIFAGRFNIVGLLLTVIVFTMVGAIGGAVAHRVSQTSYSRIIS